MAPAVAERVVQHRPVAERPEVLDQVALRPVRPVGLGEAGRLALPRGVEERVEAGLVVVLHQVQLVVGLELVDASISAVVRCAPPDNKPLTSELNNCRYWLEAELDVLEHVRVVICLGGISFDRTLRVLRDRGRSVPSPKPKFAHAVEVTVDGWTVIGSYHPSQQNTFTGRLTEDMLDAVFARARELIDP